MRKIYIVIMFMILLPFSDIYSQQDADSKSQDEAINNNSLVEILKSAHVKGFYPELIFEIPTNDVITKLTSYLNNLSSLIKNKIEEEIKPGSSWIKKTKNKYKKIKDKAEEKINIIGDTLKDAGKDISKGAENIKKQVSDKMISEVEILKPVSKIIIDDNKIVLNVSNIGINIKLIQISIILDCNIIISDIKIETNPTLKCVFNSSINSKFKINGFASKVPFVNSLMKNEIQHKIKQFVSIFKSTLDKFGITYSTNSENIGTSDFDLHGICEIDLENERILNTLKILLSDSEFIKLNEIMLIIKKLNIKIELTKEVIRLILSEK